MQKTTSSRSRSVQRRRRRRLRRLRRAGQLLCVLVLGAVLFQFTRPQLKLGTSTEADSTAPSEASHSSLSEASSAPMDAAEAGGSAELPETGLDPSEDSPDLSQYPEALQALWEKNDEAHAFILDYFERKDEPFEIDLSQEAASDTVPLLLQWDQRWGYETYAGSFFGCTGCGPTCLSMAALYLTGNPDYSPKYVAEYATEQGYAIEGSGTAWALMSDGAAHFGLTSQELPLSEASMLSALESGKLIICVLGPGDFTDNGHFIVLTGYQDGAFTVNDPNSRARSAQTWSYEQLFPQIKNLWALGTGQASPVSDLSEQFLRIS